MISYMRTPWGRVRDIDERAQQALADAQQALDGFSGRSEAALDDLADTLALIRTLALIAGACVLAATVIYAVRGIE